MKTQDDGNEGKVKATQKETVVQVWFIPCALPGYK